MSTKNTKVRLKNKLDQSVKIGHKTITTDVSNVYSISNGDLIGSVRYRHRNSESLIKVNRLAGRMWSIINGGVS